jgi:hypothetical protein
MRMSGVNEIRTSVLKSLLPNSMCQANRMELANLLRIPANPSSDSGRNRPAVPGQTV